MVVLADDRITAVCSLSKCLRRGVIRDAKNFLRRTLVDPKVPTLDTKVRSRVEVCGQKVNQNGRRRAARVYLPTDDFSRVVRTRLSHPGDEHSLLTIESDFVVFLASYRRET